MKSVVNPPTPWPNWQAPVSTRKTRPTIMERAVEGKHGGQGPGLELPRGHFPAHLALSTAEARTSTRAIRYYYYRQMGGWAEKELPFFLGLARK